MPVKKQPFPICVRGSSSELFSNLVSLIPIFVRGAEVAIDKRIIGQFVKAPVCERDTSKHGRAGESVQNLGDDLVGE